MNTNLRILMVEDNENDALLIIRELTRHGYKPDVKIVCTGEAMSDALDSAQWDIIISDYAMPEFSGSRALALMKEKKIDLPFIIVSGTIEEEIAVASMKAGAQDYITKDNLARLVPAVEREIREACNRREGAKTEEALVSSEARFKELTEMLPAMIFELDDQLNITFVNKQAASVTGCAANSSTHFADLFCADDQEIIDEDIGPMMASDTIGDKEYELCGQDGETIHVILRAAPIRKNGHTVGLRVVLLDISQRKQAEEILQDTQKQLLFSQKMEAIGRLAGGVAHDFNNLLGAIIGYSDIMMAGLSRQDPLYGDLTEISKASMRASELTKQLLAFSRKQILSPKVMDINKVVQSSERMLARLIGEDITMTMRLDPQLNNIKADPGQIEQVIMNLVINARDAMPEGGRLTIETSNTAPSEQDSVIPLDHVVLSVSDTGTGMTQEVKNSVFEPFFTTKKSGKGTGLGLSTVYGIVTQSGGTIDLQTTPDQGTTFNIYLPVFDAPQENDLQPAVQESDLRGSETVMVVEDEDLLRNVITRMLRINGYQVLEARHPEEALFLSHRYDGKIDVLLTDLVMPQMNGIKLAQQLSEKHPEQKVLYMSGYSDDLTISTELSLDNLNYIQKPFSAEKITLCIRKLIKQ